MSERWACVDVAAFPLQLLLRRHPDWRGRPVAVVAEDKPQAPILWVNEPARRHRVLPGMRYAAALSLCGPLSAAPVGADEIDEGVALIVDRLSRLGPRIEPSASEPGVVWLDAAGLDRLHPSRRRWAEAIREALAELGLVATVVVGFTRFGTYALARSGRADEPVRVLDTPAAERRAARSVRLDRLGLSPRARDVLARLGVHTVGELLRLPAGGLMSRLGDEVFQLHRLASGGRAAPLDPTAPVVPVRQRLSLDDPEPDAHRLLFLVKRLLDPLLELLAAGGQALVSLQLRLSVDRAFEERAEGEGPSERRLEESIRPAEPTLDGAQVLDLVRLRLEALARHGRGAEGLGAGVTAIELELEPTPARAAQLPLFSRTARRDPAAAGRALARLRADLGDDAVVRAELREGHLPEARFQWRPIDRITPARPQLELGTSGPLVRRLLSRSLVLPTPPHGVRDNGWLLRGLEHGPVVELTGPFVISGGWWVGPVHREYHFAETARGDLLWVYYDRRRRRWVQQGAVE